MIQNSYEFDDEEAELLSSLFSEAKSIPADAWSRPELESLRLKIKKHYMEIQSNRCCYCRQEILDKSAVHWNLDHVVPRILAPAFTFEPHNLAAACHGCNTHKSDKDIRSSGNTRKVHYRRDSGGYKIVHPHYDDYDAHIEVEPDKLLFIPRTDKGEETVQTCRLIRLTTQRSKIDIASGTEHFAKTVERLAASTSPTSGANAILALADAIDDRGGSAMEVAQEMRAAVAPLVRNDVRTTVCDGEDRIAGAT